MAVQEPPRIISHMRHLALGNGWKWGAPAVGPVRELEVSDVGQDAPQAIAPTAQTVLPSPGAALGPAAAEGVLWNGRQAPNPQLLVEFPLGTSGQQFRQEVEWDLTKPDTPTVEELVAHLARKYGLSADATVDLVVSLEAQLHRHYRVFEHPPTAPEPDGNVSKPFATAAGKERARQLLEELDLTADNRSVVEGLWRQLEGRCCGAVITANRVCHICEAKAAILADCCSRFVKSHGFCEKHLWEALGADILQVRDDPDGFVLCPVCTLLCPCGKCQGRLAQQANRLTDGRGVMLEEIPKALDVHAGSEQVRRAEAVKQPSKSKGKKAPGTAHTPAKVKLVAPPSPSDSDEAGSQPTRGGSASGLKVHLPVSGHRGSGAAPSDTPGNSGRGRRQPTKRKRYLESDSEGEFPPDFDSDQASGDESVRKAPAKRDKGGSGAHGRGKKEDKGKEKAKLAKKPAGYRTNLDWCSGCLSAGGGALLECDNCLRAFHAECAGVKGAQSATQGGWECPVCVAGTDNTAPEVKPTKRKGLLGQCEGILDWIWADNLSEPFQDPVEGVEDYDDWVVHRMDLSEIKRRLKRGDYNEDWGVVDFIKDVRQIWHNSMMYNVEGTLIHRQAQYFDRRFSAFLLRHVLSELEPAQMRALTKHEAGLAMYRSQVQRGRFPHQITDAQDGREAGEPPRPARSGGGHKHKGSRR